MQGRKHVLGADVSERILQVAARSRRMLLIASTMIQHRVCVVLALFMIGLALFGSMEYSVR